MLTSQNVVYSERDARVKNLALGNLPVTLFANDNLASLEGEATNISLSGMFVKTDQPLQDGSIVKFNIPDGNRNKNIRGKGLVVWRRMQDKGPELPMGVGLQVFEFEKGSEASWHKILEHNLERLVVTDIMQSGISYIDQSASLTAASGALNASSHKLLGVTNQQKKIVGYFSADDLINALAKGAQLDEPLQSYLNLSHQTLEPSTKIHELLEMIMSGKKSIIPIGSADNCCGVVSLSSVLPLWSELMHLQSKRIRDNFVRAMNLIIHDLSAPISIIKTTNSLLSSGIIDIEEYKNEGMCDIVEDNCDSMQGLIDDLFLLTKNDYDEVLVNLTSIDLASLLQKVVRCFMPQAINKDINLSLVCSAQDAVVVRGEMRKLGRIFNNLVSNALKYTPRSGRVTVELAIKGNSAQVGIRDNGRGIAAESLGHIFDEFAQLGSIPTGGEGSIGLGMFITKRLVEAHQGRISVDSQLGEGTHVVVTLPLHVSMSH